MTPRKFSKKFLLSFFAFFSSFPGAVGSIQNMGGKTKNRKYLTDYYVIF